MTPVLLTCGDSPRPLALRDLTAVTAAAVPDGEDIESTLALAGDSGRIAVIGDDRALAATLTRLMRLERLDVELAYVPERRTPATATYDLPSGSDAAAAVLRGEATTVPLIRDDAGIALVGLARMRHPDGESLVGEAYVDDERLFSGSVPGIRIRPTPELPGLRAAIDKPRMFGRYPWMSGRAVQLGTPAARIDRDGVPGERTVKRSTFYRHEHSWKLVRRAR